jgi:two-component system, chemotaxis family, chemotaxis protein CheY
MKSALLVDSEPPICELLQEILKSEGIEAVTLASASEAANCARAQKFDVVFVDSSSPVTDGIELTRKIRGSGFNRRTPIVMITTPKYTGFLTEGFEAGASFLVYKPIDRTRLLRLVRVMRGAIENEIRRFRRVAVQVKALVRSGEDEVEAATIDLSLNGTLVRAQRIFPRGSPVKINLFLGPTEAVVGHGSVMRTVSDNQMGIQFDGLSFNESARLQDFLLPLITA